MVIKMISIFFKFYDDDSGITFQSKYEFVFEDDRIIGTYNDPFIISFDEINNDYFDFNLFPNPFNESLSVSFNLTNNQNVKMKIFDLVEYIKTYSEGLFESGNHEIIINSNDLEKGYYIIELEIDSIKYEKYN